MSGIFIVLGYNFLHENQYLSNKIKKILQDKLKIDFIDVKSIIETVTYDSNPLKVLYHEFKDNKIYMLVEKEDKTPITIYEANELIEYINEMGPDTWMEGDISIISYDEAKFLKIKPIEQIIDIKYFQTIDCKLINIEDIKNQNNQK